MNYRSSTMAVVAMTTLSAPVAAQVGAGPTEAFRATLEVAVGVRRTTLRSRGATMIGGDARVQLSDALSIGGGGWLATTAIPISGETVGSDLALDIAYAGLVIEHRLGSPTAGIAARLLLGAGNAKVSLPLISTEIAADNFGVVEPEVVGVRRLTSFLAIKAQVGYRLVFGVEDLPQVDGKHLRGASASISLSITPF